MAGEPCMEPCCVRRREEADGWAMLCELYRVLVRAGAGSSQQPHTYSYSPRRPKAAAQPEAAARTYRFTRADIERIRAAPPVDAPGAFDPDAINKVRSRRSES